MTTRHRIPCLATASGHLYPASPATPKNPIDDPRPRSPHRLARRAPPPPRPLSARRTGRATSISAILRGSGSASMTASASSALTLARGARRVPRGTDDGGRTTAPGSGRGSRPSSAISKATTISRTTSSFPVFSAAEPRLVRGFEVLETDHENIHCDDGRSLRGGERLPPQPRKRPRRHDARRRPLCRAPADQLLSKLGRHLEDEEDLIIPLILDRGEGPARHR